MPYPPLPASFESYSHYVDVDGIRTHYLAMGEGEPLILIHGGGAGADGWGNWHSCLNAYAERFRVIAYDMPGFGRTDKPSPETYDYSQANRNRHLRDLISALHLEKIHLIGNSMGGATALGLAIDEPSLVEKMVLMGSAGLDIANPDPTYIKDLQAYDFTLEGMQRIVRAMAGSRYEMDPELVRYRHEIMQQQGARDAIRHIVRSKLTYPREKIAAVKTPTLVVGGKEDKVAILERTYGYLELLENSWGFVVPHAGHWVMIEAPEAFVSMTINFIANEAFSALS